MTVEGLAQAPFLSPLGFLCPFLPFSSRRLALGFYDSETTDICTIHNTIYYYCYYYYYCHRKQTEYSAEEIKEISFSIFVFILVRIILSFY